MVQVPITQGQTNGDTSNKSLENVHCRPGFATEVALITAPPCTKKFKDHQSETSHPRPISTTSSLTDGPAAAQTSSFLTFRER